MDMTSKIKLSSWDENAWMHIPGALAWASLPVPHPTLPHVVDLSHSSHSKTRGLSWPCILYPSWSEALTSTDIPLSKDILLLGCKKKVSISKLRKNIVPGKMALGSSELVKTEHGSCKRRKKVVCYFLGMDDRGWCAVNVSDVRRYERDSCMEILRMYSTRKDADPVDGEQVWGGLILSMKEASLALSNADLDPNTLCKNLDIGTKIRDVGKHKEVDSPVEDCTPECFDDWRAGGYTQNTTQGATRFSLQTQSQVPSQGLRKE